MPTPAAFVHLPAVRAANRSTKTCRTVSRPVSATPLARPPPPPLVASGLPLHPPTPPHTSPSSPADHHDDLSSSTSLLVPSPLSPSSVPPPPPTQLLTTTDPSTSWYSGTDDHTASSVSAALQAILEDLLLRPDYYVNVAGACVAMLLATIVLSATTNALDHLPILPDLLRFVGLCYSLWFLATYLLSPVARSELTRDINEFVDTLSGGRVYTES